MSQAYRIKFFVVGSTCSFCVPDIHPFITCMSCVVQTTILLIWRIVAQKHRSWKRAHRRASSGFIGITSLNSTPFTRAVMPSGDAVLPAIIRYGLVYLRRKADTSYSLIVIFLVSVDCSHLPLLVVIGSVSMNSICCFTGFVVEDYFYLVSIVFYQTP